MTPKEGVFVLHLFYHLNREGWNVLAPDEQRAGKERLTALLDGLKAREGYQATSFAVVARADFGFMLVGADLHVLQETEKRITAALGAGVLIPAYTFFSMTERSEYISSEEEYAAELKGQGLAEDSEDYIKKIAEFRVRIEKYAKDRLYPTIPAWEFISFYPMSKRRNVDQNWFSLPHGARKELMKTHATTGRKFSGRILQIITGSTGLDDWEWGVTLFAHDPYEIKAIVYEMRFDEVSARYAEFGEFYNGIVLAPAALFERVGI
ncbi:chlorite dismutase [Verrucomicrobium sp. GAS474]|nr:chlorite dismutase [Verrucomicrobium sp. GAS474]